MQPMRNRRRGSSLLEFTMLGIPVIFLVTSVITCSVDMWQFYTLAYAVDVTARYAVVHGATCSQNGNTCTITRANMVTFFEGQSPALDTSKVNVTLTDGSGSTNCNPVTSCAASNAQFPASANNSVGSDVTIKATYPLINPIAMFWYGSGGVRAGSFTVGATSTQRILF